MKYIDAEKLIAEIERYENTAIEAYNPHGEDADFWNGKVVACEDLKTFVTSLQQELPDFADASKMEQPSVEDAMKALDEKIALVKENGTWDGVDVDKYMDEVRGREPEIDFEKEVDKKVIECTSGYDFDWEGFARHFYELGLNARKQ